MDPERSSENFRRDDNEVLVWGMNGKRLTFRPCKGYLVRDGQETKTDRVVNF